MIAEALSAFTLPGKVQEIFPYGTGLINRTWKVVTSETAFIAQQVNHHIFTSPADIAYNTEVINNYLSRCYPDYLFVTPVPTKDGKAFLHIPDAGYFRLFSFVPHSHTIDVVNTTEQACEAARQFGRFTSLLSGFDAGSLRLTLPHFHNLSLRYAQFEEAIRAGNRARIAQSEELIRFLQVHQNIVTTYEGILHNPDFKVRVTHHDTKISNVLFNAKEKGLCVIDLDTVMPGYFISDAGDMMRTYLSPVSEEETEFSKIKVREDYFEAVAAGYLGEMKTELTPAEKTHFVYAGKFMTYMQCIRFLTDYLNNDAYYGASYEEHNFVRAGNQATLLKQLLYKEERLMQIAARLSQ